MSTSITLEASPLRPLSWSYFLEGAGHEAVWKKQLTSEQGAFLVDDVYHSVVKDGAGRGAWRMVADGTTICGAKKESAFRRRFHIDSSMGMLRLEPVSAFSRSYGIGRGDELVGLISPKRFGSRKAEIDVYVEDYDFPTIVFAFWLVALMWRRAGM